MPKKDPEHILIIGGGVGGALAHDLTLRGFRVTLVEKGELLSGTTGRHHGLLHSGTRYVFNDPETARECFEENQILRDIAPEAIEPNNGLFIALDEEDLSHETVFVENCRGAGIPLQRLSPQAALQMEPALNPSLKAAYQVPDAAVDAWRLALPFFATAKANGASIRPYCQVTGLAMSGKIVTGAMIRNLRSHRDETLPADLVINAAGPWAGHIADMAAVRVPIQPVPGVMVSVASRLTNAVINRLHPAGEGDIIVPQRRLSVLGTTAWMADDPDQVTMPAEHTRRLIDLCAQLVPAVKTMRPHAVWSASRPLLKSTGNEDPFGISRTFDCFDHAPRDGVEGLITLIGGKATTMRAMAEKTADLVCKKTGRQIACRTKETRLHPYRTYWKDHENHRI